MMQKKWKDGKYIAYFQAYTNTYAPVDELRRKYEEEKTTYDPELVEVTFAPGEHIVAVGIDDPMGGPIVYPGHLGYKPVGVSASTYGKYQDIYYAGYKYRVNVLQNYLYVVFSHKNNPP